MGHLSLATAIGPVRPAVGIRSYASSVERTPKLMAGHFSMSVCRFHFIYYIFLLVLTPCFSASARDAQTIVYILQDEVFVRISSDTEKGHFY